MDFGLMQFQAVLFILFSVYFFVSEVSIYIIADYIVGIYIYTYLFESISLYIYTAIL